MSTGRLVISAPRWRCRKFQVKGFQTKAVRLSGLVFDVTPESAVSITFPDSAPNSAEIKTALSDRIQ